MLMLVLLLMLTWMVNAVDGNDSATRKVKRWYHIKEMKNNHTNDK